MTSPTHDSPFMPDSDVHAYLDGELAPDAAASMEARLSADVQARILLKSLTVQRDALLSKFPLPDKCPVTHAMVEAVLRDADGQGASEGPK